jgi:hypothetical protein
MTLDGQNICVLDVETLRSANDCRWCQQPLDRHGLETDGCQFEAIGWERKADLGLSIGCYYDYADAALHWFDVATLASTMQAFVEKRPLLVSYNGIAFDFPLMWAVLRAVLGMETPIPWHPLWLSSNALCDAFKALCATSYDLLAEIWKVVPRQRRAKGMFTLDAVSEANGLGRKLITGALAPRLWAQGRYAEVIAYNVDDVLKTKRLFEQILSQGGLWSGNRGWMALRPPDLPLTLPLHTL